MGMTRSRDGNGRKAISLGALLGILAAWSTSARADHREHARRIARADGEDIGYSLNAEVECDASMRAGKVRCVVHLRPVGGTLHFSDVLVLSAPEFAPAVRDRIAFRDAQRSDDDGADLPLLLTAKGGGDGELYVMGRATVCGGRGCRPVQGEASAHVVVGSAPSASR